MIIDLSNPSTGDALKISGELNVSDADGLRQRLAEALVRQPVLVLDLSEVRKCDFTTLQLIWSARESARRANKEFRVMAVSPVVTQAAAALGLPSDLLSTPPGSE